MKRITVMYIWNDLSMGGATQSLLDTLTQICGRVNCLVTIREKISLLTY